MNKTPLKKKRLSENEGYMAMVWRSLDLYAQGRSKEARELSKNMNYIDLIKETSVDDLAIVVGKAYGTLEGKINDLGGRMDKLEIGVGEVNKKLSRMDDKLDILVSAWKAKK